MWKDSTKAASNILLGAEWYDSIEAACVRTQIRGFIEGMLEVELSPALGRARYERAGAPKHLVAAGSEPETKAPAVQSAVGHRNGHRDRQLMGTFGATTVSVPRARLESVEVRGNIIDRARSDTAVVASGLGTFLLPSQRS